MTADECPAPPGVPSAFLSMPITECKNLHVHIVAGGETAEHNGWTFARRDEDVIDCEDPGLMFSGECSKHPGLVVYAIREHALGRCRDLRWPDGTEMTCPDCMARAMIDVAKMGGQPEGLRRKLLGIEPEDR